MIKNIIFDYDGTIADSVNIKTEAFAELYRPYGKVIERKVVEYHLSHGGISRFEKFKYFHKYLLNIELSESEIEELALRFSKLVIDKVVNAPFIENVFQFIKKNHNVYDMFISTATPKNEIIEILNKKKIINYFVDIYGSPENKFVHIRNILLKGKYLNDETVFIGDSYQDEEVSGRSGIRFIQITKEHDIKFLGNIFSNLEDTFISIIGKNDNKKFS